METLLTSAKRMLEKTISIIGDSIIIYESSNTYNSRNEITGRTYNIKYSLKGIVYKEKYTFLRSFANSYTVKEGNIIFSGNVNIDLDVDVVEIFNVGKFKILDVHYIPSINNTVGTVLELGEKLE